MPGHPRHDVRLRCVVHCIRKRSSGSGLPVVVEVRGQDSLGLCAALPAKLASAVDQSLKFSYPKPEVLAVGAVILSALVTAVTSEVGREQRQDAAHAQMLDACASLARRAGPLLERGDELRLSVLATSAAELSRARVLVLDREGVVRIDTGVGLGGYPLGLEAVDGPVRRDRAEPESGFEAIAPALGHAGGAGEVRLRYAIALGGLPGFAWGTFGLSSCAACR
jgi:hypothetical protein